MVNKQKLKFLKNFFKTQVEFSHLPNDEKDIFLLKWKNSLLTFLPYNLYKYREYNEQNVSALRSRKAWFSNPLTWNDDIDVTVKYNLHKENVFLKNNCDKFLIKFANSCFDNDALKSNKHINLPSNIGEQLYLSVFKGDEEFNPQRMINFYEPILGHDMAVQITLKMQYLLNIYFNQKNKEEIADAISNFFSLNEMKKKFIMYSVSETYNNDHQWTMYTKKGNGFCIGYSLIPKIEKNFSLLLNLLPVYYGDKKEIEVTKILFKNFEHELGKESKDAIAYKELENIFISFNTKKKEWSGEQEWRFVLHSNEEKGKLVDFDFANALYLGESLKKSQKDTLIEIAKKQGLKVFQRKLDNTKSNWIYKQINLK